MMDFFSQLQSYFAQNSAEYLRCLAEHIQITLLSLGISALIGIPLGYCCHRFQQMGRWITGIFQVLRIVPSLAVLILLIPVLGVGLLPALVALILLAVPPILMNTTTAFAQIPAFYLETAQALGMDGHQKFWRVELPTALPQILVGVKTAAVEIVASAAIAAKIGAGGLGGLILTGLGLMRTDLLVVGGGSVALLAVCIGLIFELIQRRWMPYASSLRG